MFEHYITFVIMYEGKLKIYINLQNVAKPTLFASKYQEIFSHLYL